MSAPDHPTRSLPPDPATGSAVGDLSTKVGDPPSTVTHGGTGGAPPGRPAERYALGAEIARGGMGAVHRATDAVLNRPVAVKVIQSKYAPESAAARRFAREARITAQLQHPAIPPVHDLGSLPDGRPFLAMKLIQGETLHDLLAKGAGDDRGRFVAVFEKVCEGVAYAHAQGVIHRDLKPANVMVGAFGEVQVMDWGLAKVIRNAEPGTRNEDDDPNAAEESGRDSAFRLPDSELTAAGSVLGTPAFMPPEQASGATDQIDARSDVFGLGGLLAAILTGNPPFVARTGEQTRQLAARGTVEPCFARLDASGADPELVSLCKRCLAAEKADRPADAGEVAAAVAALRSAADERARQAERDRVSAEVAATAERKRRRVVMAAAAAVVGVLLAGAGASVWQAVRAWNAERATQTQLGLTQTAEAAAKTEADNARAAEGKAKVEEKAARHAEALAKEREEKEKTARTAAEEAARFMIEAFAGEGKYRAAAANRAAAKPRTVKEAMDDAAKSIDGRFGDRPELEAELRNMIGKTYLELAAFAEARPQLERALAIREKALGPDHPDTLLSAGNMALLLYNTGDLAGAEPLFRRALVGYEKRYGPDHPYTLLNVANFAAVLRARGDYAGAEPLLRRALDGAEKALGPDHRFTLGRANNLGSLLQARGDFAAAEPYLRRALDGWEKTLGPDHPDTLTGVSNLGSLFGDKGDLAAAEVQFRRTLTGREKVLGPDHPSTLRSAHDLGTLLQGRLDFAGAESHLRRALAGREKVLGPNHPDTLLSVNNLGSLFRATGDAAAAELQFSRALAGHEKTLGADHPKTLTVAKNLGDLFRAKGDVAAAELLLRRARAGFEKVFGPDHPDTLKSAYSLAHLCSDSRRHAEAAALFETVHRDSRKRPDGAVMSLFAQGDLGLSLLGDGKPAAAEPHLLSAAEWMTNQKALNADTRNRLRWLTAGLIEVYDRTNQPEKAKAWRAKLAALPPEVAPPPRPASR